MNLLSIKAIQIKVYGRVQGVYFRANTCQKAIELGLAGSVQNQHDGSVLIIAEGNNDSLQQLINWCHKGPLLAKVTLVNVLDIEPTGFKKFDSI